MSRPSEPRPNNESVAEFRVIVEAARVTGDPELLDVIRGTLTASRLGTLAR